MSAIPFPISSAPGERAQEGAGRLINAYAEKTEPGSRFPVIWKRTPGLRQAADVSGHTHFRGGILVSSTLVGAWDERVYAIDATYTATNLGALDGTGPITVAKNNAGTPNIVAVTAAGCFNLFTGSAPTSFVDADLPQPNSVAELNGYFLWTIGDGRIFASGLNAVTVSASAFTTEQSLNGLLRGVAFRGEYFAFGQIGTAAYRDIGASPFPLERYPLTIQKGICGTHAVTGWEPGGPDELVWVGEDGIVYQLQSYKPVPISNDDVARVISRSVKAGNGSLIEGSCYAHGKHQIVKFTLPGSWTWEYNITTQNWNERQSYGRSDCRASRVVRAFGEWLAGDRTTGKLFKIDDTYYREADDPLVWELRSGIAGQFPMRQGLPRADFDFTAAVGDADGEDPIQTDPSVLISWSDDGGFSYGSPVSRPLGGQGQSEVLVSVLRTGMAKAKGRRYRLQVSDPVPVGFMGGQHAAQARAA